MRPSKATGCRWRAVVAWLALLTMPVAAPFGALAAAPSGGELTVAAAASLQGVLRDVRDAYVAGGGQSPTLVFGASGSLARQIRGGAPYDVFASADAIWIRQLESGGHIVPGTARTYALGQLALVAHRPGLLAGLPEELGVEQLARLAAPDVRVVALANPRTAPYGAAARAALEQAGLWRKLEARVVFGENVRQALTFVDTGNADAGLVATALVLGSSRAWRAIAPELHPPIRQTVALLAGAPRAEAAQQFVSFLTGPEAAAILLRHGLKPVRLP